mgnify:CR=1 FL=1
MAGTLTPTTGEIFTSGRVTALLELGGEHGVYAVVTPDECVDLVRTPVTGREKEITSTIERTGDPRLLEQ